MTGWFIVVQIRGRNDIADVAWGVRFVLAAAVSLIAGQVHSPRDLLIFALELIWGLRLALHIHNRNRGKGKIHATGSGARNGASGLC
jgi:steroid 5-alpha reductase family enzyme